MQKQTTKPNEMNAEQRINEICHIIAQAILTKQKVKNTSSYDQ